MKDFAVVNMLGKGSYGSVYKCRRRTDGKLYAVKEVNIRKLSPREREDAVNEIRILASVSHEHIIRYCDAFTERDNLYIVMEFAEQGDVAHQIKKFKRANKYVKEDTVWSYFLQIITALQQLHSRRILHRDIKPQNVFLTSKNHIRIGDLGCAKLMKTGLARTQIGTPYYMSPEIWAQQPYDSKSDIWAVGCLVYELCMLNPPFIANDMRGLARKVKTAPAPRISRHYSKELADVISSMLMKSPGQRPDVERLLAMPAVRERMHLLPAPTGAHADRAGAGLLATIKLKRRQHAEDWVVEAAVQTAPQRSSISAADATTDAERSVVQGKDQDLVTQARFMVFEVIFQVQNGADSRGTAWVAWLSALLLTAQLVSLALPIDVLDDGAIRHVAIALYAASGRFSQAGWPGLQTGVFYIAIIYVVIIYALAALIWASVATPVWVLATAAGGDYKSAASYPGLGKVHKVVGAVTLRFLRTLLDLSALGLFVPILSALLSTFRCSQDGGVVASANQCWSTAHVTSCIAAVFCIVAFCIAAGAAAMLMYPRSMGALEKGSGMSARLGNAKDGHDPLRRAHWRSHIVLLAALACLSTVHSLGFATAEWTVAALSLVGLLILYREVYMYLPFASHLANQRVSCILGAAVWCAGTTVFIVLRRAAATQATEVHEVIITGQWCMVLGLAPFAYMAMTLVDQRWASVDAWADLATPLHVELKSRRLLALAAEDEQRLRRGYVTPALLVAQIQGAVAALAGRAKADEAQQAHQRQQKVRQMGLAQGSAVARGSATSMATGGFFAKQSSRRSAASSRKLRRGTAAERSSRKITPTGGKAHQANSNALPSVTQMALDEAEELYADALDFFGNAPMMHILCARFMLTHRNNKHVGQSHYRAVMVHSGASVGHSFEAYEQQRRELNDHLIASSAKGTLSITARVGFERHKQEARDHEIAARSAIADFWSELLSGRPSGAHLSQLSAAIRKSMHKADASYRALIRLNSRSVGALRQYAQFLLEVSNDSKRGMQLIGEADAVEEEAQEAKARQEDIAFELMAKSPEELDTTAEDVGVITASSNPSTVGTITDVNSAAVAMWGYSKREMIGSNLSMLMPEPMSCMHDMLLRRYLAHGQSSVMDVPRMATMLHKQGYLVPSALMIRNLGEEGFGGVIRPMQVKEHLLLCTAPNGAITGACQRSMEALGLRPERVRKGTANIQRYLPNINDVVQHLTEHRGMFDDLPTRHAAGIKAKGTRRGSGGNQQARGRSPTNGTAAAAAAAAAVHRFGGDQTGDDADAQIATMSDLQDSDDEAAAMGFQLGPTEASVVAPLHSVTLRFLSKLKATATPAAAIYINEKEGQLQVVIEVQVTKYAAPSNMAFPGRAVLIKWWEVPVEDIHAGHSEGGFSDNFHGAPVAATAGAAGAATLRRRSQPPPPAQTAPETMHRRLSTDDGSNERRRSVTFGTGDDAAAAAAAADAKAQPAKLTHALVSATPGDNSEARLPGAASLSIQSGADGLALDSVASGKQAFALDSVASGATGEGEEEDGEESPGSRVRHRSSDNKPLVPLRSVPSAVGIASSVSGPSDPAETARGAPAAESKVQAIAEGKSPERSSSPVVMAPPRRRRAQSGPSSGDENSPRKVLRRESVEQQAAEPAAAAAAGEVPPPPPPDEEKESKHQERLRASLRGEMVEGSIASSRNSRNTSSVLRRAISLQARTGLEPSLRLLRNAYLWIIVVVVVLNVGGVVMSRYVLKSMSAGVESVADSGQRQVLAMRSLQLTQTMHIMSQTGAGDAADWTVVAAQLERTVDDLEALHQALYLEAEENEYTDLVDLYTAADAVELYALDTRGTAVGSLPTAVDFPTSSPANLMMPRSGVRYVPPLLVNATATQRSTGLLDAGVRFAALARRAARTSRAEWRRMNCGLSDPNVWFVLANGPTHFRVSLSVATSLHFQHAKQAGDRFESVELYMAICIGIIISLALFCVVVPIVARIAREKNKMFRLFSDVPRLVLKHLRAAAVNKLRRLQLEKEAEESGGADELAELADRLALEGMAHEGIDWSAITFRDQQQQQQQQLQSSQNGQGCCRSCFASRRRSSSRAYEVDSHADGAGTQSPVGSNKRFGRADAGEFPGPRRSRRRTVTSGAAGPGYLPSRQEFIRAALALFVPLMVISGYYAGKYFWEARAGEKVVLEGTSLLYSEVRQVSGGFLDYLAMEAIATDDKAVAEHDEAVLAAESEFLLELADAVAFGDSARGLRPALRVSTDQTNLFLHSGCLSEYEAFPMAPLALADTTATGTVLDMAPFLPQSSRRQLATGGSGTGEAFLPYDADNAGSDSATPAQAFYAHGPITLTQCLGFRNGLLRSGLQATLQDFTRMAQDLAAQRVDQLGGDAAGASDSSPFASSYDSTGALNLGGPGTGVRQRNLRLASSDVQSFRLMGGTLLNDGLAFATTLHMDALVALVTSHLGWATALAVVSAVVLLLLYIIVIRPTVAMLDDNIKQTRAMMLLLPDAVVRGVPRIHKLVQDFAAAHSAAAANALMTDGEGSDFDE